MPRARSESVDGSHLLNFTSAPIPRLSEPSVHSNGGSRRPSESNAQRKRREQQEKVWLQKEKQRSRADAFFLHSSADHAFVLARDGSAIRHGNRNIQQHGDSNDSSVVSFSYAGPDVPVQWDAVRIVKCLVSTDHTLTCPICLDGLTCARITKCGHVFCLSCILRHIYVGGNKNGATISTTTNNNNITSNGLNNASGCHKCPCCSVMVHATQLRSVSFHSVLAPQPHRTMRFIKLHRRKGCFSPYLPISNHHSHYYSVPHAAPTNGDPDSLFCRFNYVRIDQYMQMLATDRQQLLMNCNDDDAFTDPAELTFVEMALQMVLDEEERAQGDAPREFFMEEQLLLQQQQQPHTVEKAPILNDTGDPKNSGMNDPGTSVTISVDMETNVDLGACTGVQEKVANDNVTVVESQLVTTQISTNPEISSQEKSSSQGHKPRKRGNRKKGKQQQQSQPQHVLSHGSMYLDKESSHFYQASDGQLCFLSAFNINCLAYEFSVHPPPPLPNRNGTGEALSTMKSSESDVKKRQPLPDVLEANVVDTECVHLTPELRKRMPCLSHLPLYVDVTFCELNLQHLLSRRTKDKFRTELEKRRKQRLQKEAKDQKAEQKSKVQQEKRIRERMAQIKMQQPDPMNQLFHFPPSLEDMPSLIVPDHNNTSSHHDGDQGRAQAQQQLPAPVPGSVFSFNTVCAKGGVWPGLGDVADTKSRTPSGSDDGSSRRTAPWGSTSTTANTIRPVPKRTQTNVSLTTSSSTPVTGGKRKGKKVVLFSTGMHRGS